MFAAINAFLTRAVTGYFLNKSLRFRSSASAYLSRTFGTPTSGTTWTWSGWVKLGLIGSAQYTLFSGDSTTSNYGILSIGSSSANTINFVNRPTGPSADALLNTTQVFRDPAAWYHIVAVWNTTSATTTVTGTPTDRLQLWVNGVQIKSFSSTTVPAQNTTSVCNSAIAHELGAYVAAGGGYGGGFDGEMAEINFVDGQALAPTAFGASSIYNQWLPIKYAGTYGTNGFYLPFNSVSTSSYAASFSNTTQCAQVADNTVLAFGTNPFTIEMWVYPTASLSNAPYIFAKMNSALNTNPGLGWYINVYPNAIYWGASTAALGYATHTTTTTLNAWTHLAFTRVGSSLTCYVNGVSVGTQTVTLAAANNDNSYPLQLGNWTAYTSTYFTGYMSNVRVVKGTAVYTANFVPPTAPLTAISGTSLLTLQSSTLVDNSGNSLAITNQGTVVSSVQYPFSVFAFSDSSGNGNNWTPNNISLTAGSTYDSLTDVPTLTSKDVANYAVLNPLTKTGSAVVIQDANLTFTKSGAAYYNYVCATIGVSSGKFYWEITFGAADLAVGITNSFYADANNGPGFSANAYVYLSFDGNKRNNNSNVAYGATFQVLNDVVGIALDMDAGTLTFYKNGVSQGQAYSGLTGVYFPYVSDAGGNITLAYANFGQRPFAYPTLPTGFLPLNTFNI